MVKKFRRYVYSFCYDPWTWRTDRQTPHNSIYRAYAYASRGKNSGITNTWCMWLEPPLVWKPFSDSVNISRLQIFVMYLQIVANSCRCLQWRGHGGEVGGAFEPPPNCPPGPLTRFAQNRWENIGDRPTPPPWNVVPTNTLVLVAHFVTFSESQWYQFHVQLVGFGWSCE